MNLTRRRIVILVVLLVSLCTVARAEQAQKPSRIAQEDRIKKLEDRADAAEKATAAAAMEKDYIVRTQKLYESYYQRTLSTQLWTLGIVLVVLTAVFVLVARFSLNLFEQRTKLAITDASAQLRNEYARILAKEVQKLWDSNTADNRKLKDALASQAAELEQNFKHGSDFQIHFVQGLAGAAEEHHDDSVVAFRQALTAYKSGKARNLIETKVGAATVRYLFESLGKKHGESYVEQAREEMANPLYNGLEEELALAALQSPWLTPLINERNPALPEPPAPEYTPETRPTAMQPAVLAPEQDWPMDGESDSCRLLNS